MKIFPLWAKFIAGFALLVGIGFVLISVLILYDIHTTTIIFVDNKSIDTVKIIRTTIDDKNVNVWKGYIAPGSGLMHRTRSGIGRHRYVMEAEYFEASPRTMTCDFEIKQLPSICSLHFTDSQLVCEYCAKLHRTWGQV